MKPPHLACISRKLFEGLSAPSPTSKQSHKGRAGFSAIIHKSAEKTERE